MPRAELIEWIVMLAIIVAWWPMVFLGWGPVYYRFPLYVASLIALAIIFIRRLRRTREGLAESERMKQAAPKSEADKKL